MYRREHHGLSKHIDFVILDLLCLQLAYVLAYLIFTRGQNSLNPYTPPIYRSFAIMINLVSLVILYANHTLKNVLKRGNFDELVQTIKHAVYTLALCILLLYLLRSAQQYSRLIVGFTFVYYAILTYAARYLWKGQLNKQMEKLGEKSLLIVTNKAVASKVIDNIRSKNFGRYRLAGLVILDEDLTGSAIDGVPVVSTQEDAARYVCQQWIDEVLVVPQKVLYYPKELMDQLMKTGVTVHYNLAKVHNEPGKKQLVEKIGDYTVLTRTMNYADPADLLAKRLLDIVGGLVGCLITGIVFIFVAPMIYLSSPGPIFFAQERVGKNGKKFKLYKFRSMYMDAEERKAALMAENKISDAKMFKLDFDPRVIGNKILPDGTKKTGIGQFIRDTSLDEFPQFWCVLKGDMSLCGTRPPLMGEVSLYELHHRSRLAIKPGITGMWQVSGRSSITDFEEVVRLDQEYINNWSLALDIKILLKTVLVVFKKEGAV